MSDLSERILIGAFWVFMWPALAADWLNEHLGWTLGIGWGSVLLIVALIVRGAL